MRLMRPIAWMFSIIAVSALAGETAAQAQRGQAPQPAATARAAAPVDLTGVWVSLVTNEWRWRMLTPEKGDYAVLPINAEARRIADTWDPAKDEASGEQCKGYGAAAIMQMPARLRVAWDNDNTLRMDIDTGTQTRLFRFGPPQPAAGTPTWQGNSAAEWQVARGRICVVTTFNVPLRAAGVAFWPSWPRPRATCHSAAEFPCHVGVPAAG